MRAPLVSLSALALALSCVGTPAVGGQVSCTVADDLCTGDPCVTTAMEVESPCVVDFGPRTLVIGGALDVPPGGVLDLTAGEIEIRGTIDGRGTDGADVSLTATTGGIRQFQRVIVTGTVASGAIELVAAGDIDIGSLIASAGSRTATAGSVLADAAGMVTIGHASRIGVQGGRETDGGQAIVRGATAAYLTGHLEIGGATGATVELSSSGGPLFMGTDIRGNGKVGTGGSIVVSAATDLLLTYAIKLDGKAGGGDITVTGDTVTLNNRLRAKGKKGPGGTITVSGNTVLVNKNLQASGRGAGGRIVVTGEHVTLNRSNVDARGKAGGGEVLAQATVGDLLLSRSVKVGPGGAIQGEAAGNLTLQGRFQTRGGGCIGLTAGGALDTTFAALDTPVSATCGLVP